MKPIAYLSATIGVLGGVLSQMFGGWDQALGTLLIFMAIDYMTGLMVGFTGKSKKTQSGALNSHVGYIGLCKKFLVLLYIIIATRLDMLLNLTFCRDAVIVGFIVNELVSITENAGLLGIPMPAPIKKAIDILHAKEGKKE